MHAYTQAYRLNKGTAKRNSNQLYAMSHADTNNTHTKQIAHIRAYILCLHLPYCQCTCCVRESGCVKHTYICHEYCACTHIHTFMHAHTSMHFLQKILPIPAVA